MHSGKLVLKKEEFQFKKKVEKTFNTFFYKLDTRFEMLMKMNHLVYENVFLLNRN